MKKIGLFSILCCLLVFSACWQDEPPASGRRPPVPGDMGGSGAPIPEDPEQQPPVPTDQFGLVGHYRADVRQQCDDLPTAPYECDLDYDSVNGWYTSYNCAEFMFYYSGSCSPAEPSLISQCSGGCSAGGGQVIVSGCPCQEEGRTYDVIYTRIGAFRE